MVIIVVIMFLPPNSEKQDTRRFIYEFFLFMSAWSRTETRTRVAAGRRNQAAACWLVWCGSFRSDNRVE